MSWASSRTWATSSAGTRSPSSSPGWAWTASRGRNRKPKTDLIRKTMTTIKWRNSFRKVNQQPRVRFPACPKCFQRKRYWFAEVNQWHWLGESGLRLENADRTHLVLACDNPFLQKSYLFDHCSSDCSEGGCNICHRNQRVMCLIQMILGFFFH